MLPTRLAIVCVGLLLLSNTARAEDLVLADQGQSAYRIVVAEKAAAPDRHAAEELQTFLHEISGARLPIVSDREPPADREILVGPSARVQAAGVKMGQSTSVKPLESK